MIGILPTAFLLAMGLGGLIIAAVVFRYVIHRSKLDVFDIVFCLVGFALMFPSAFKSIDLKNFTISFEWVLDVREPPKGEVQREQIEQALVRIETRLASCSVCRTDGGAQPPVQVPPPSGDLGKGPRVVVIWEPQKVDDGRDIVAAIRAIPQASYRVEGVRGDLDVVRGALPGERTIDIRLVSKPENVTDRDAIYTAIVAKNAGFKGRIERSTWPLANGDVQIQIFQR
jgi:hypothetical protein